MIITDESQLRVKSTPVLSAQEGKEIIAKLLAELQLHENGMGLSAIQIGIPKRVFVLKESVDPDKKTINYIPFINPEITDQYDELTMSCEGCLSFPGQFVTTRRFNYVSVKGVERAVVLNGTLAVAAQHEMDHMDGVLFFDRKFEVKSNKVGRNSICPCGSGKKFKHCCLK